MTRLSLVELAGGTVLDVFPATRGSVKLPDGSRVSPPVAGWRGGGELTYAPDPETGRQVASAGPARYVIAPVKDAKIPASKRPTGPATFTYDEATETTVEAYPTQTIPIGETRAALVARVKGEAAARIVAIAPEWKQRNLTAQAVLLAEKGRARWTAEEAAAWAAGEALWRRIAAIRAASDAIEAAIGAATTHGGAEAAYRAGEWPE